MDDTDKWWSNIMAGYRDEGRKDAGNGVYNRAYPDTGDPNDCAEDLAYYEGFKQRRLELGDKFKWQ